MSLELLLLQIEETKNPNAFHMILLCKISGNALSVSVLFGIIEMLTADGSELIILCEALPCGGKIVLAHFSTQPCGIFSTATHCCFCLTFCDL